MDTFNIIKRNRKYFAAIKGSYKCRILIDSNSDGLEIGEHQLDVEDISVRTKYGVDLIFKLKGSAEEQSSAGICTLRTPRYNSVLVEKCRTLGGKWDRDAKAWVFSGLVSGEVDLLDEIYNSDLVGVELTAKDLVSQRHAPVEFAGFSLAKASDRDSGAVLCDGVALIAGKVRSGGSVKNWVTVVEEGTVLRMEVPRSLIKFADQSDFDIKLI